MYRMLLRSTKSKFLPTKKNEWTLETKYNIGKKKSGEQRESNGES